MQPKELKKVNPILHGWIKAYKRVVYSKAEWVSLNKDSIPFVRYVTKCLIVKGGVTYETTQELEPVTVEFGGMVHAYIKKKVNYGKGVNQPKKYGKCFTYTKDQLLKMEQGLNGTTKVPASETNEVSQHLKEGA